MKKTIKIAVLTGCALGIFGLSYELAVADGSTTSMSCCGMGSATVASETNTNAIPDLLTTCPVSGEKLGEMGAPYVFTYSNQVVKLCCPMCKKDFDKNPDKYIGTVRGADNKP